MSRFTVGVGGMTCENCVRHVTEAIEGVNVVTNANLLRWVKVTPDYESGRVKK